MKKVIIIFILIISQNLFSQEYFFDKFYEYDTNSNSIIFYLVNSKDSSYVFLGDTNNYTKMSGHIYDFKTHEKHYYEVSNGKNTLEFKYIYSKKTNSISKKTTKDSIEYEFLKTNIDSNKIKISLSKYKVRKKKKLLLKAEFEFKKEEWLSYNAMKKSIINHFLELGNKNSFDYIFPLSISYDYQDGLTNISKLTKTSTINTLLSLIEDQKTYIK